MMQRLTEEEVIDTDSFVDESSNQVISDDNLETYEEGLLKEKIKLGISYFRQGNDQDTADYFINKFSKICNSYFFLLNENLQKDSKLKQSLYQSLERQFGEEKAQKTINNYNLTLSIKNALYYQYISALDELVTEIESRKKINIKTILNDLIVSNISDEEINSKIIEVRDTLLNNFSEYKKEERDDLLSSLYSFIYITLKKQVRKNNDSLYNALSEKDKIFLTNFFLNEVRNSGLRKEEIDSFLSEQLNCNEKGISLDVLKSYLSKTSRKNRKKRIEVPDTSEESQIIQVGFLGFLYCLIRYAITNVSSFIDLLAEMNEYDFEDDDEDEYDEDIFEYDEDEFEYDEYDDDDDFELEYDEGEDEDEDNCHIYSGTDKKAIVFKKTRRTGL